jgi:cob(I)alamin adenosyltransferase
MRKGLVQVYTGTGKGKTTAALGLALRAIGQGLKVCFIQFMKSSDFKTGEMVAAERLAPDLKIIQFGKCQVWGEFKPKECVTLDMKKAAHKTLDFAKKTVQEGHYNIVVLDEINMALKVGLLNLDEVLEFLKTKPKEVELILTGREAPDEIISLADLVTEMTEVKHPYKAGIKARRGIDY